MHQMKAAEAGAILLTFAMLLKASSQRGLWPFDPSHSGSYKGLSSSSNQLLHHRNPRKQIDDESSTTDLMRAKLGQKMKELTVADFRS